MKLINREKELIDNEYVCSLTNELDILAGIHDSFFGHYILINDFSSEVRSFPLRVAGGTVGTIYLDKDNKIADISIITDYIIDTYPDDINTLIKSKYLGVFIN